MRDKAGLTNRQSNALGDMRGTRLCSATATQSMLSPPLLIPQRRCSVLLW